MGMQTFDREIAEYARIRKPFNITTLGCKFEEGKWYKSTLHEIRYFKFESRITLSSYNKIIYSESIKQGKYKCDTDYIANTSIENSLRLLTDLSEIQQYLPEGHEDLIKEAITNPESTAENKFKFDRWYTSSTSPNMLWFIKSVDTGFGINANQKWFVRKFNMGSWELSNLTLATDIEIKEKLLSYAKNLYNRPCIIDNRNLSEQDHGCIVPCATFTIDDDYTIFVDEVCVFKTDVNAWAKITQYGNTDPIPEAKPDFNRNIYIEIKSQEELDSMVKYLKSIGETVEIEGSITNYKFLRTLGGRTSGNAVWDIFSTTNLKNKAVPLKKEISDFINNYPIRTQVMPVLNPLYETYKLKKFTPEYISHSNTSLTDDLKTSKQHSTRIINTRGSLLKINSQEEITLNKLNN